MVVATGANWKYSFGAIASSDLLMGEDYDARLELPGWDQPGFDDAHWYAVEKFDDPGMALVANDSPTVQRIEELVPISDPVDKSNFSAKRYIFDLGQNMVGWVRFKGSAPAGTTIRLQYAEVLNPDGTLYTTNLRTARAPITTLLAAPKKSSGSRNSPFTASATSSFRITPARSAATPSPASSCIRR